MLDIIFAMIQDGAVSQTTSGMHVFDLFTEPEMKRKGAKRTLNFGTDETDEENDAMLVSGVGGTQSLHWGIVDQVEETVEILNLDGADNYRISITDSLGHHEEVSVSLVGSEGELELQIHSDLPPNHQQILAKKINNLNSFMQRSNDNAPSNSPQKPIAISLKPHNQGDNLEY